jgi:hypothetical protein
LLPRPGTARCSELQYMCTHYRDPLQALPAAVHACRWNGTTQMCVPLLSRASTMETTPSITQPSVRLSCSMPNPHRPANQVPAVEEVPPAISHQPRSQATTRASHTTSPPLEYFLSLFPRNLATVLHSSLKNRPNCSVMATVSVRIP